MRVALWLVTLELVFLSRGVAQAASCALIDTAQACTAARSVIVGTVTEVSESDLRGGGWFGFDVARVYQATCHPRSW